MNTREFLAVVEDFVAAPTNANKDSLNSAADHYRDWWIETRVPGQNAPSDNTDKRDAETGTTGGAAGATSTPPTTYDREMSTSDHLAGGIPVRLVLQERTSARERDTWWVVSWRTRLRPGGPNRRFYKTQNRYWSLPANVALDLMQELRGKGGLRPTYDDHRRSNLQIEVSADMPPARRQQLLHEVTGPEEDWGSSPFFVIAEDPHPDWRKVMIVNTDTGSATFRSLTKNTSYRPRTELRPDCEWSLDNSMMDAGAQQMRAFLERLEQLLGK